MNPNNLKEGDLLQGSDGWLYKVTEVCTSLFRASLKGEEPKWFWLSTMEDLDEKIKLTKL